MKHCLTLIFTMSAALVSCAHAAKPADIEYGPYTVSVINEGVYHIQDYNSENPSGETFNAEGEKTHFNNCSDIYLLVGNESALLIDLSNRIDWADNAAESLRTLVSERTKDKALNITFTHNHGDHTGMISAYIDDPDVKFLLPETDFSRYYDRISTGRAEIITDGHEFDLGGMKVQSVPVPGHTKGSVVFFLEGKNLMFSGDALGSGHGVWLFDTDGFKMFRDAIPSLISYIEDGANGIDKDKLQIYGGHYWQKDWLDLPENREIGWEFIEELEELISQIADGTAAKEDSNLGREGLDTYFRNGNAIITWSESQADKLYNRVK